MNRIDHSLQGSSSTEFKPVQKIPSSAREIKLQQREREGRATETEEQQLIRLTKRREYDRRKRERKRELETTTQRETRLHIMQEKQKIRIQSETPEASRIDHSLQGSSSTEFKPVQKIPSSAREIKLQQRRERERRKSHRN